MEDINKDIKELEESIKEAYRCYDYDLDYNPLSKGIAEIIEHLIKAYKELKEENEKLKSDNLEYQRTQDIFDERTYRKKYLEERRKEEPNLLYPDSDEIYKRYYKLKEENATLKKAHNISENVTIQDITNIMNKSLEDFNKEYVPVSLVEEKIEELNKSYEDSKDENGESEYYYPDYTIRILEELLERRK